MNTHFVRDDDRAGAITAEVPVLMYHSISVDASRKFSRFAVHPNEFAAQMDYLDEAGYHPITAVELVASRHGGRLPERPITLTFDDAYTDFHSTALPILQKHDFCGALYVPTGYVGANMRFLSSAGEEGRMALSWNALREVAAAGVELAAHSHTHPQMDRISPAVSKEEVYRSRCLLEDKLEFEIVGFAYPFGYWNSAARAAVAANGFRYAFTVGELIPTSGHDVFTLPRLTVNAGIGVDGFARLLKTRSTYSNQQMAAAKRVVWRTMRQMHLVGGDPREGWHGGAS